MDGYLARLGNLIPTLGAADFEEVRENGIFYADKTKYLAELIRLRSPCFLARPRRFGKTLLVSALEHVLLGHREMFEGLWIHGSDHDWTPCPVIRLNMNLAALDSIEAMNSKVLKLLGKTAKSEGLEIPASTPSDMFLELIWELNAKHGKKVAVLIDEYDAPITLHIADPAKAEAFRRALRQIYGVLKGAPDERGFVFVTGVSRFTKTSIFSELNDLTDLTCDDSYAEICGFTEADLDALLDRYQAGALAKFVKKGSMAPGSTREDLKQLILDMYDGYSWDGLTRVVNPWSTLSCLAKAKFRDFWFESGTPSFLKKLLDGGQLTFDFSLGTNPVTESEMVIDDIAAAEPTVLMLQAGYLTLKEAMIEPGGNEPAYIVGVPNVEVFRAALPLMSSITPPKYLALASGWAKKARQSLLSLDKPGFEDCFHHFLEQYPCEDHVSLEACYRTRFRTAMCLAGQPTNAQERTGSGRLDFRVERPDRSDFIIEVKPFNDPDENEDPARLHEAMSNLAREAMTQISEKYVAAFEGKGSRIVKVALVVARRTKVLVEFESFWSPRV